MAYKSKDKGSPWLEKAGRKPEHQKELWPASACDDQLPIFSRVGRGLKGDSLSARFETGADGYTYLVVTTTPSEGGPVENRQRVDGGKLRCYYAYQDSTSPATFTLTFVYDASDPASDWSFTTPAIPYFAGDHDWSSFESHRVYSSYELAKILGVSPDNLDALAVDEFLPIENLGDLNLKQYIDAQVSGAKEYTDTQIAASAVYTVRNADDVVEAYTGATYSSWISRQKTSKFGPVVYLRLDFSWNEDTSDGYEKLIGTVSDINYITDYCDADLASYDWYFYGPCGISQGGKCLIYTRVEFPDDDHDHPIMCIYGKNISGSTISAHSTTGITLTYLTPSASHEPTPSDIQE